MKKWKIVLLIMLVIGLIPFQWEKRTNYYLTNDIDHGCKITGIKGATIFTDFFFEWDGGECNKPKNSIGRVFLGIGLLPAYNNTFPFILIFAPHLDSYIITINGFDKPDQEFRPRIGVKTLNVAKSLWEYDYDFVLFYGCERHKEFGLSYDTSCDIVINVLPFEIHREEIQLITEKEK